MPIASSTLPNRRRIRVPRKSGLTPICLAHARLARRNSVRPQEVKAKFRHIAYRPAVKTFYKKECQEKSSPSTGGREDFVSRSSPLHRKSASRLRERFCF